MPRPRYLWRTAESTSGLREIRWHDPRHSFASHLAMRGIPIPQIQQRLGQGHRHHDHA